MASMSDNYGVVSGKDCTFPAGVRVLVVDDDFTWLKIVEQMLTRCNYSGKQTPLLILLLLQLF